MSANYRQIITAEQLRVGDELRGWRGAGFITPEPVTAVTVKPATVVIETAFGRYTRRVGEELTITTREEDR